MIVVWALAAISYVLVAAAVCCLIVLQHRGTGWPLAIACALFWPLVLAALPFSRRAQRLFGD